VVTNPNLIIDFVNSWELDEPDGEELDSPAALVDWLAGRELLAPGTPASDDDLAAAVELREALRTILGTHNEVEGDVDAATSVLDASARRAGLQIHFGEDETRLEPAAPGVAGALGRILSEVAGVMRDETWLRMKACRAEDCRWAYLDTAKNRSRAWCSMSSCGNRAKVRAYRERRSD
jgi:predicted RNA-binding Zn ribbon-like protein